MKNWIKIFCVTMIFGLLFNSCKKYSEDPFISLKKPEKRIAGVWDLTSYRINGVENIKVFEPSNVSPGFEDVYPPKIEIIAQDKLSLVYNTKVHGGGGLAFNKDKSMLDISFSYYSVFPNAPSPTWPAIFFHDVFISNSTQLKYTTWLVKRLYLDKMHLTQYSNGKTYELEFQR